MTRSRTSRTVVSAVAFVVALAAGIVIARVLLDDPSAAPAQVVRDYIGDIGARRYADAYGRLCERRQQAADPGQFESIVAAPVIDHDGLDEVVVKTVKLPPKEGGRTAVVTYRVVWNDGTVWNDEAVLERVDGEWLLCEFAN